MKKLLLLLIVFAFSKMNVNAQIQNGSFESWNSIQTGNPNQWMSANNEISGPLSSFPVSEVAGHTGSAIRMETFLSGSDTIKAYVTNGDPMGGEGGIPCAAQPLTISGYYRYNVAGNDTALLIVMFKKNGAIIAENMFPIVGVQNTFTTFSFPLSSSVTPDSVIIAATSSNLISEVGITPGSFLELDELAFTGAAVTIPNGGFDAWTTSSVDFISDWQTNGDVQRTTDSQDGLYAMQLTTVDYGQGNIYSSEVTNGEYSQNGMHGGSPYSSTQDTLCGYYKYYTNANDSGSISVSVSANANQVGGGYLAVTSQPQYTYFEIPIGSMSTPDSMQISARSSASWPLTQNSAGSVLIIDHLILKSELLASIKENASKNPFSVVVFPNPSSDLISIRANQPLTGEATITIYDASGREVKTESMADAKDQISINISTLSIGNYFFTIKNGTKLMSSSFTKN